jgi:acetyl esterase/lipase
MSNSSSYRIVRIDDVVYRTATEIPLMLNIVRPDPVPAQRMPALVYLFGGAWMENNRASAAQDRNPFLAARGGFFTVSIDYRLSSQALFPAQIADARAAVRWLRRHADVYHLDPQRIGAMGYSSGGHLAALLGTAAADASLDDEQDASLASCAVQAVVTIAAPTDFLRMGGWHDVPASPEARLVGGPIQDNPDLVRRANPITYVAPSAPPFLLIHGEQDDVVPCAQSRLLYEALVRAGVEASLLPLAGAGHDVKLGTPYWDVVNQAALAFFRAHLQPQSR